MLPLAVFGISITDVRQKSGLLGFVPGPCIYHPQEPLAITLFLPSPSYISPNGAVLLISDIGSVRSLRF